MAETAIHRQVAAARSGTHPAIVARMRSGWVVAGDPQVVPGYCLLLPDPVEAHLNALAPPSRARFLEDMALLGDALLEATGAVRINYEMLGNLEPALHAHLFPRYNSEEEQLRAKPVWFHDWTKAPAFDKDVHGQLVTRIRAALSRLGGPAPGQEFP